MKCGWLKETFWQRVTIHGLDKYNTMFKLYFYIFTIIFSKPKDIALQQEGLIDPYISYNRIDEIIGLRWITWTTETTF